MGKTKRDIASSAGESFNKHYATIWGAERWYNSLYPALAEQTRYAALVNRFSSPTTFFSRVSTVFEIEQLEQLHFPTADSPDPRGHRGIQCFTQKLDSDLPSNSLMPAPELARSPTTGQPLMTHWNLDAASVLAAYLLDVRANDNVFDLCGAPGGKSIALALNIWPQLHEMNRDKPLATIGPSSGFLRSNESDRARHKRLSENLKQYLPAELFESKHVATLQIDGTEPLAAQKLSIGSQGYDKVLVDAPCSSERHIIHAHNQAQKSSNAAPEMANWRPGSSKRLAKTQVELLMTGLKAAKIGGRVMYATCSIEPTENDGVVEKVLAIAEKEVKKGVKWSVSVGFNDEQLEDDLDKDWAERTKYGWIVLPDHLGGGKWGPLFFAMLTKAQVPR